MTRPHKTSKAGLEALLFALFSPSCLPAPLKTPWSVTGDNVITLSSTEASNTEKKDIEIILESHAYIVSEIDSATASCSVNNGTDDFHLSDLDYDVDNLFSGIFNTGEFSFFYSALRPPLMYSVYCETVADDSSDPVQSNYVTFNIIDEIIPELDCQTTPGVNDGSQDLEIVCSSSDESALADDSPLQYNFNDSLGADTLTLESDGTWTAQIDVTGLQHGEYPLVVHAYDYSGNHTEQELTGIVISAPPDFEYCQFSPAKILTPTGATDISCKVTSEVFFDVTLDAEELGNIILESADDDVYTGTLTITPTTPVGEYTLTAFASDGTSESSYNLGILTVADGQEPLVECTATGGDNNSGIGELVCEIIEEAGLKLNPSYTSTCGVSGELSMRDETTFGAYISLYGLTAGDCTVTVSATDISSNVGIGSATITITDELSPTGMCALDISSITTSESTQYATVTCTDVVDETTSPIVSLDSGILTSTSMIGSGSTYSSTVSIEQETAPGTYNLVVTITDGLNPVEYNLTLEVLDGVLPDVSCPAAFTLINDGTSSILECSVSDAGGIADASYTSSSLGSGSMAVSGSECTTEFTYSGAGGTDTLNITAEDNAGNTRTVSVPITLEDVVEPTVGSCTLDISSITTSESTQYATVICTDVVDETTSPIVSLDSGILTSTSMTGSGSTYSAVVSIERETAPETYNLVVTITDGLNPGDYYLTLEVLDGVLPDVSCPAAFTLINDGTSSILECSMSDAGGIADASYTSSSLGSGSMAVSGSECTTEFTYSGAGGTDIVDITAEDNAGNTTTVSVPITLEDVVEPTIGSCDISPTEILSPSGTARMIAYSVADETGIDYVTATIESSIVELTHAGLGNYTGTFYAGAVVSAGVYSVIFSAFDSAGNISADCLCSVTVTDGAGPNFNSVYASPDSVLNDGSETFQVYACVEDGTDGTEVGGGVTVLIDSLEEMLSYNSGTECYESREINGDELSPEIYTLEFTAEDAAGNISTDASATLEVTCTAVAISNVAVNAAEVYNNNEPHEFTVTADVSDGSCGTLDTSSVEVTIDGLTQSMTLDYGATYTATIDALADVSTFVLGNHTVYVSASNTVGGSESDSSESIIISDICDNLATDAPGATVGIYADGVFEASLSTAIPSKMSSVNTIRIGAYGAQFYSPLIFNYDNAFATEVPLTTSSAGGSYDSSTGLYTTSSYADWSLGATYNCTSAPWSISAKIIASSSYNHSLEFLTSSGTGTTWYRASSTHYFYVNDGSGTSALFASTPSGDTIITLCGNP